MLWLIEQGLVSDRIKAAAEQICNHLKQNANEAAWVHNKYEKWQCSAGNRCGPVSGLFFAILWPGGDLARLELI